MIGSMSLDLNISGDEGEDSINTILEVAVSNVYFISYRRVDKISNTRHLNPETIKAVKKDKARNNNEHTKVSCQEENILLSDTKVSASHYNKS